MDDLHQIGIAVVVGLTTMATRFIPFLLFGGKHGAPEWIRKLGIVLPSAIMGMLVIYCMKDVAWLSYPYGIPELVCCAVTAGLHLWKRNYLLSIAAGTVLYMLLVQLVFI